MSEEDGMALWQKSEYAKVSSQIRAHATMALGQAYRRGDFRKPLEELSDQEVLEARGCGEATLRQLRSVIPAPGLPDV